MQENRKTIVFVIVALMAVLVAWEPWRPAPASNSAPAEVGTKLYEKFTDPLEAKNLEIVTYDEDNATIADFKVAQVNGVWSIPSHSNYPADAKEHMAQAATALLGLEILGVASNSPGDQELYGVVVPDPEKLKPGAVGVGRRVTLKNDRDNVLADLVIGKEVKDQPALHYVRRTDRDQIYRVNVKTDKLTTKFEDWIEKDLLKLNAFDVRNVELNDYSTQTGLRRDGGLALGVNQRSRFKLAFDDSKSSWSVVDMATFDEKGKAVPGQLGEDEELNAEKLNALKTALDDLKIVDVERKPAGLSQDLRATDEFVNNREAVESLAARGFYPVSRGEEKQLEILSSEGEATCTTKDGVRYVLRFGNLAGGSKSGDDKKPGETDKSNPALNRYLFVMVQLDESQIAKPQLEAMPGEAKPAADDEKAESKAGDDKPADEKADDENVPQKKTADEADQPATKSKKSAGKAKKSPTKAKQKATGDTENNAANAEPAKDETPKADAAASEKQEEKTQDRPAAPDDEKRIAIEKENKRKQDEYDSAVKKGQDKVKELNDRFADWYFIISDDVYKKIHLGRADIVKEKKSDDKKDAADKTDKE